MNPRDQMLDDVLVLLSGFGHATPERTYKEDGGWGLALSDIRRCITETREQLTTAHLDNERLRKALTIGLDSLEKSIVVAIDSCDCHGCKAVRSIRQALATPTPNPIKQELKEL